MAIILRDGSTVEDPKLGRLVQYDERSKNYPVRPLLLGLADKFKTNQINPRSYSWRIREWHDQGREGACVAFAHGHRVSGRSVEKLGQLNYSKLIDIYRKAQLIDPWPETHEGGEEGTSVLAGAKIMQELDFYNSYRWIFGHDEGLKDAILTLGYVGGLVMGTWWWSGMYNTDERGFVSPTGSRIGGHAWYVYGIRIRDKNDQFTSDMADVDLDNTIVFCRNSWGRDWGVDGDFKLTLRDWNKLRLDQGEAMLPVETGRYFGDMQVR